jgi:hypothetical protein
MGNDQNQPHIPSPDDLSYLRDFAKTPNGYIKRIARVMTERPELDTFSFDIGPLEVAVDVLNAFRAYGWKARFVTQNHDGPSKVEIYWPD